MNTEIKIPNTTDLYRHNGGGLYRVLHIATESTGTGRPDKYPISVIYMDTEEMTVYSRPLDKWWDAFQVNDPVKHMLGNVRDCLKDWLPDGASEISSLHLEISRVTRRLEWLPKELPIKLQHGVMADNYHAKGWNACLETIQMHRTQEKQ